MISQFFILTPRGDTVVSKDYRGDCPRGKHSVTPLFVSSLGVYCRDFISDALKSDDVRSPCQLTHTPSLPPPLTTTQARQRSSFGN